eukprot:16434473-Heterocapsa_arctica.AAC.1
MVPPAWKQEVDFPAPDGRPRGPVSLLIKKIRNLGWTPVSPGYWTSAEGEPIDPTNGEQARWHLNDALTAHRWREVGNRRLNFLGAERGFDEASSFRLPRKSWNGKVKGAFGIFTSIISGGTWPAARKAKLANAGAKAGECPHCRAEGRSVQETAIRRWWQCPRWEIIRNPMGEKAYAHIGARHNDLPRCLWECGLLPLPQ